MAEPFLSEIKMVSFSFPPKGWALCNGQTLPINQNQALFSLLGTTYGGDGVRTFLLPNLQGRVPVHVGNGIVLGESGGETDHTLGIGEIPAHRHVVHVNASEGSSTTPATQAFAQASPGLGSVYGAATNLTPANPQMIGTSGQGNPHTNQQPYLSLNFIIALQGIFPSQN